MTLTSREKRLLLLLAIVIVLAVYLNFLIFPKLETIQQYSKELKDEKIILNTLQQTNVAGILPEKEEVLQQQMQGIESILPSDPKLPAVYRELVSIANQTGIQQQSLSIESPKFETISDELAKVEENSQQEIESKEQLMKIPINHQFLGTYEQVKDYIKKLQNSKRRIDITQYQLSGNSSENRENEISASFHLQVYALLEEGQNYSQYVEYDFMEEHYGRDNPFIKGITPESNKEE